MPSKSWVQNVKHIIDGEPVNAGVAGRPDRTLENNLTYLKDLVEAALLGEVLFMREASVASTVLVGQPVYWHKINQQFEAALAGVENDPSNVFVPKDSADVVGVVYSKANSTLADIAIMGWVAIDLTNSVDDVAEAGRFYLSSATAGNLTTQRPPVSVPVLFADGKGNALLMPTLRDFLEDHVHYTFDLVAQPAGTHIPPPTGYPHAIGVADSTAAGWLPASDAIFGGLAPAGAYFGYNLSQHTALKNVWPPIPVSAASINWDKGIGLTGGTDVPLGVDGLVVLDTNGIWWMSNGFADVPWPSFYNTNNTPPIPAPGGEPPRNEAMRVRLHYARMVFATDKSVVTSLQPATDSPITVVNCDGDASTTGDLNLGLDLALITDDQNIAGFQVIKELQDAKYVRGPVVEGIFKSASAGNDLILSSTHQTDVAGDPLYQGRVTVSLNLDATDRELLPQIVRLSDVVERYYKDVTYLGFSEGRASFVRYKFHIPPEGLPNNPELKFRLVLLGRISGTLPAMAMTYRRVPRASSGNLALPLTDTALTLDTAQAVAVDEYLEAESSTILSAVNQGTDPIEPGDTVFLTLSRPSGTSYNAEIGVLRIGGIIAAAPGT
jgi:hypothetical protein